MHHAVYCRFVSCPFYAMSIIIPFLIYEIFHLLVRKYSSTFYIGTAMVVLPHVDMLSSQANCVIVSGFRAALDLDTYPHCNLIRPPRPRCIERAKPGRGKPVLIMHIGFFTCFSRHISRTQSFQQNCHIIFLALVALKLLVSLISRLVACSVRIVVDRQTHRPSTVTLAAHACRGLIIIHSITVTAKSKKK